MNNPALYSKVDFLQRERINNLLTRLGPKLCWNEGNEVAMDIGCGSGGVTKEILLPLLSGKTSRITGIDKMDSMVEYARKNYSHDQIRYEVIDILNLSNVRMISEDYFSKIFSFYCLNWVLDHDTCLKNIFNMMKVNGQALFIIVTYCPIYEMHRNISRQEKWKKYLYDVEDIISRYHDFSGDPAEDFRVKATKAGFQVDECVNQECTYNFDPLVDKDFFDSINPFAIRMLPHERAEYLTESFQEASRHFSLNAKGGIVFKHKQLEILMKKNCLE